MEPREQDISKERNDWVIFRLYLCLESRDPRCFTQDKQQFLSPSKCKNGDQTAAFPVDDVVDRVAEPSLSLLPLLVDMGAIGGLLPENSCL